MSDFWINILGLDILSKILLMPFNGSMTSLCLHGLTIALQVMCTCYKVYCAILNCTPCWKCGLLLHILLSFFNSQFLRTVFKCYLWMNVKHSSQCVPPAISVRPHINITSPLTGNHHFLCIYGFFRYMIQDAYPVAFCFLGNLSLSQI